MNVTDEIKTIEDVLRRISELAGKKADQFPSGLPWEAKGASTWVVVGGTGQPSKSAQSIASIVGATLAEQHIGLRTCGYEGVDRITTDAFVQSMARSAPGQQPLILTVRGRNDAQSGYVAATTKISADQSERSRLLFDRADALIIVDGRKGTVNFLVDEAVSRGIAILPFPSTGGGAEEVIKDLLGNPDSKYWKPLMPIAPAVREFYAKPPAGAKEAADTIVGFIRRLADAQIIAPAPTSSALTDAVLAKLPEPLRETPGILQKIEQSIQNVNNVRVSFIAQTVGGIDRATVPFAFDINLSPRIEEGAISKSTATALALPGISALQDLFRAVGILREPGQDDTFYQDTGVIPPIENVVSPQLQFGKDLFQSLFRKGGSPRWPAVAAGGNAKLIGPTAAQLPLGDGLELALDRADREADGRLRIRMRIDGNETFLDWVPWELLTNAGDVNRPPLAVRDKTPFARVLLTSSATIPPVTLAPGQMLRVLAVLASPDYMAPPKSSEANAPVALVRRLVPIPFTEIAIVRDLLLKHPVASTRVEPLDGPNLLAGKDTGVTLGSIPDRATLANIVKRLQEARDAEILGRDQRFHALHMLCHGLVENGKGWLVLEDDFGNPDLVSEDRFFEAIFSSIDDNLGLQLITFASCQTALVSGESALTGIARRLVNLGVPAVVAMQDNLEFEAAQVMAETLYARLSVHGEIDRAVNAARHELWHMGRGPTAKVGDSQWGLPVLFTRRADGRLIHWDQGSLPAEKAKKYPPSSTPVSAARADSVYTSREMAQSVTDVLRSMLDDRSAGGQSIAGLLGSLGPFLRSAPARHLPERRRAHDIITNPASLDLSQSDVCLKPENKIRYLVIEGGFAANAVLPAVCAALSGGKHIILTGAPGTGKTELALAICEAIQDKGASAGYALVTATADWTTFDTIGGYKPNTNGQLEFQPGAFLNAIATNRCLIIDEINRADIDKAFGELFTVLSGQAVTLPYMVDERVVRILPAPLAPGIDTDRDAFFDYVIPPAWRIIGTMNNYDKASLYNMSFAFMRRFAFIDVPVPEKDAYKTILDDFLTHPERGVGFTPEQAESCTQLYAFFDPGMDGKTDGNEIVKRLSIGPAIARDMVRYIGRRHKVVEGKLSVSLPRFLAEAIVLFVFPQCSGLFRDDAIAIHGCLGTFVVGDAEALAWLQQQFRVIFPQLADSDWKETQIPDSAGKEK